MLSVVSSAERLASRFVVTGHQPVLAVPSKQNVRLVRTVASDVGSTKTLSIEPNNDCSIIPMRVRHVTGEHSYGTLKHWMGSTFLTKWLDNVGTGMSLHVLAYNIKRAMTLVGAATILEAI